MTNFISGATIGARIGQWTRPVNILGKVPESELSLTVGSATIQPVRSVRDLGVQLDAKVTELELQN